MDLNGKYQSNDFSALSCDFLTPIRTAPQFKIVSRLPDKNSNLSMAKLNRPFFFSYVRLHLFGGSLKQSQVDGLTAILDYWDEAYSGKDDRWLAYMFATAHHETDRKFQAIEEYG